MLRSVFIMTNKGYNLKGVVNSVYAIAMKSK